MWLGSIWPMDRSKMRRPAVAAVESQQAVEPQMAALMEIGIAVYDARRLVDRAEERGVDLDAGLSHDPYVLGQQKLGLSFAVADRVARAIGIPAGDPRRVVSLVEAAITRHGERNGETVASVRDIIDSSRDRSIDLGSLVPRIKDQRIIEIERGLFMTARQMESDSMIAGFLTMLSRKTVRAIGVEQKIDAHEKAKGIKLNNDQRAAVHMMASRRFSIMTGGPGTGKTTTLATLISVLGGKEIVLAAPTGRAAKRMTEQTGLAAHTLHRALGDYLDPTNKKPRSAPIDNAEVLIVDEMSMTDTAIMAGIARALPAHASLILVGDPDQLPSIGAGAVLRDLIKSAAFPVTHLTKVQRQAEGSLIIRNARSINSGNTDLEFGRDFRFIETRSDEESAQRATECALDSSLDEVRLLSAMKMGASGVYCLNMMMQRQRLKSLRKDEATIEAVNQNWTWRVGDPVIHTVNDLTKGLVNGDVGIVAGINPETRQLTVTYPDLEQPVVYQVDEQLAIIPAYAMTIHKSQGSEYPRIVVTLPQQANPFISRMMLYTAITRAKSEVIVVGSRAALDAAIRNDIPARRQTALGAIIQTAVRLDTAA